VESGSETTTSKALRNNYLFVMHLSCKHLQLGPVQDDLGGKDAPTAFWQSDEKGYLEVEVHALFLIHNLKSIPPFDQSYLAPFCFEILSEYIPAHSEIVACIVFFWINRR
jgi:hypothetical protein